MVNNNNTEDEKIPTIYDIKLYNNNTKYKKFDLFKVTKLAKKNYIDFTNFLKACTCYEVLDYCKKKGINKFEDLNLTNEKLHEIMQEYKDITWKILINDTEHGALKNEKITSKNPLFVRTKRDLYERVKYYSNLREKEKEKPAKSISNSLV